MAYRIEITRAAARDLERLPRSVQVRIDRAIRRLRDAPHPRGAVKLQGSERTWRIRVGDYRVIYEVRNRVLVVLVIRIRHRRDAYGK